MLKRALRRTRSSIKRALRGREIIETEVPGQPPIRLVAYYDELVGYYPNCEMGTKRWFVENVGPDWVLFDCGANIGYFSILFSRLAPLGRVFAFEPTRTFEMLEQNLRHNGVTNVTAERTALGHRSGPAEARIHRIWGHAVDRGTFPFTCVDDYVERHGIERVDGIKIDVDSYDFEVLQGAEATLDRFDPAIVIELTDTALALRDQSTLQVLRWLAERGYTQGLVIEDNNFLFRRGDDHAQTSSGTGMTVFFAANRRL